MSSLYPGAIDTETQLPTTAVGGDTIPAEQANNQSEAIKELETKVGTGASVAADNTVLKGTGAEESQWGTVDSEDMTPTGVAAGDYTNVNVTVDAAGRITAIASGQSSGTTPQISNNTNIFKDNGVVFEGLVGITSQASNNGYTALVSNGTTDNRGYYNKRMLSTDYAVFDNSFFGNALVNFNHYSTSDVWESAVIWGGLVYDGATTTNYATVKHVGFIVDRSGGTVTVRATSSDGVTQETTDVTVAAGTITNMKSYHVEIDSGEVRFYINGTQAASHTTNVPTGTADAEFQVYTRRTSGTDVGNRLDLQSITVGWDAY